MLSQILKTKTEDVGKLSLLSDTNIHLHLMTHQTFLIFVDFQAIF
jgi:hypothetical protein